MSWPYSNDKVLIRKETYERLARSVANLEGMMLRNWNQTEKEAGKGVAKLWDSAMDEIRDLNTEFHLVIRKVIR